MLSYTFNPPEEELINYYLNNKITGENEELEAENPINVINLCHHEPEDIPGLAKIESSHTWYFISPVKKFGRLNRTKRASRTGHWKITGNSRTVKDVDGNLIGLKKFLVFRENKRSSTSSSSTTTTTQQQKTNWIIHEFHSFLHHPNKDAFVLCKLMKKTRTRRSGAVSDASPTTTTAMDMSLASDPIHNHSLSQNTNIVGDYGGDYCNDLEELLPVFHTSDWPHSGTQIESFHVGSFSGTYHSWEGSESSGLQLGGTGHVDGHNTETVEDAYSGSWSSDVALGPGAVNDNNVAKLSGTRGSV